MADIRFEEKILYKCHQHWIIPCINSLKLILTVALPVAILTYFLASYSWIWTSIVFLSISAIVVFYDHYLWHHSWLMIGNQKITLSVRNGIFSQYAMNIRYRNIRDSAVSKNSIWGYLFKYGTLFVRSSANEGDFQAKFVPKVGKVYALVNALSRYSDDERMDIDSIEKLHNHHQKKEFTSETTLVEENKEKISTMPGILGVIELESSARKYIGENEEIRNHGVHEVLRRKHVICLLHDRDFRAPTGPITAKTSSGEVYFPGVSFPEVSGHDVISASPGNIVHTAIIQYFPYAKDGDATVIIGWND